MIGRAEIRARLETAFRACFFDPALTLDETTTVADIDGWDSLSHVRLILAAQHEFGVELSPDQAARLGNVRALIDYIAQRLAAAERG